MPCLAREMSNLPKGRRLVAEECHPRPERRRGADPRVLRDECDAQPTAFPTSSSSVWLTRGNAVWPWQGKRPCIGDAADKRDAALGLLFPFAPVLQRRLTRKPGPQR